MRINYICGFAEFVHILSDISSDMKNYVPYVGIGNYCLSHANKLGGFNHVYLIWPPRLDVLFFRAAMFLALLLSEQQ